MASCFRMVHVITSMFMTIRAGWKQMSHRRKLIPKIGCAQSEYVCNLAVSLPAPRSSDRVYWRSSFPHRCSTWKASCRSSFGRTPCMWPSEALRLTMLHLASKTFSPQTKWTERWNYFSVGPGQIGQNCQRTK